MTPDEQLIAVLWRSQPVIETRRIGTRDIPIQMGVTVEETGADVDAAFAAFIAATDPKELRRMLDRASTTITRFPDSPTRIALLAKIEEKSNA